MARTTCITSFDLADLPAATVLAETVKAAHPDWEMHAIVIEVPGWAAPEAGFAAFDRVTSITEFAVPDLPRWLFGLERDTTRLPVAAVAAHHLLQAGAGQVVYLDADSAVFHPLDLDLPALEGASLLLAPQQISPGATRAALRDGELAAMRLGVFSPGFFALRNSDEGRECAAWLDRMMRMPIADGRLAGAPAAPLLFNLAPALFAGLHILRDPGYAVSPRNIALRRVAVESDGRITVNGSPLRQFHPPRPGSPADAMLERHGGDGIAVYEVLAWYRRQTARAAAALHALAPWSLGTLADGSAITPAMRRLWRERHDLHTAFDNPYATGPGTLHAWLGRERPDLLGAA